ncbi:hypothetical protein KJ865_09730, partial [Myxococcota bacterium]|nr:hypothetical protein [Myxococcota bacterium]
MNPIKTFRLVVKNIKRNSKQLLLASIGIVIGLWAFSLFLGFGLGITNVVEGEIFPWDKLEVIPPATNLASTRTRSGKGGASGNCDENDFFINEQPNGVFNKELEAKFRKLRYLDDGVVELIRKRHEVR